MQHSDIRKAGLKVTLPRLKILELLESGDQRHLTAEELYSCLKESGEEIGLATVYRVLDQFEKAGLVCRHRFEGGQSVYEIDQGNHHDHMICLNCGKVDEFVDEIIEKRQERIAEKLGYDMTDHALVIYGICSTCKS